MPIRGLVRNLLATGARTSLLASGTRQPRIFGFRDSFWRLMMSESSQVAKRMAEESSSDLETSVLKRPRHGDELPPSTGSETLSPTTGPSAMAELLAAKVIEPDMDVDVQGSIGDEEKLHVASGSRPQQAGDRKDNKKKKSRQEPRGRNGRRPRNEEDAEWGKPPELDADGNPVPKALRYPKRQCGLLLGFCGSGYSGMQIQPEHSGTKTIEGVLFNALVKIGAVSKDNADNPTKVGLARAARTDAGVHAAGNLVSLKMIVTIPGVKDIVAKINEELPPEIRLWGYCRTQNSFNARLICESRKYTYFFPSYMLIPPKPGSGLHRVWTERYSEGDASSNLFPSSTFWDNQDPSTSTKEEDMARKRAWRIGQEQVDALRKFAEKYEGTHNFHNFTVGRDVGDRSNLRYMKRIEVTDPVVYGETEWISVLFHGQSFMLHQASRKMMSILVLGPRMGTSMRVLSELYGKRSVFVPKMPALGLLLEEPLFGAYNQKVAAVNEKLQPTDAEYRPPIDFDMYRDQIDDFKAKFIYKNMREIEDRDGLFDAWIRAVDAYAGSDLLYLNPSGAVPDAAVVTKGVKRVNPFREKRVFDTTSFSGNSEIKKKLEDEDEEGESEDEAPTDRRQLEETEG